MNYFKTFLLMLGLMGVCLLVGRIVGGPTGMLFAFIFAAVTNLGAYWFSDKMILANHGATEVLAADEPRLYRAVQKLAVAAQIPMPKVYVVETDVPNAFATGRNLDHAAVAATRGILDLLSADELEAVIGHELSHIRHRDMLTSTIAATMAGAIMMIASMARWAAIFGGFGGRDDERRGGGGAEFLVLAILAPLAATLIQLAISRSREYAADEGSAYLTNNPGALCRALEKLEAGAQVETLPAATPATAHLYIVNPFAGGGFIANLFSTHPSTDRRVARLEAIQEGRIRPGL